MRFNQFMAFAAAAKYLNITKASEELHVSQPSVSRYLRLLQEDYRVKLYNKVGRGIELTEEGRAFLNTVNVILIQLERLKKNVIAIPFANKTESLTVGGSLGLSASFLPSLLADFRKSHPQAHITLRSDTARAIEQLVLKSEVEIALVTRPARSPYIVTQPYRQEKLVVFASVKHPLARRRQLTLLDLERAGFIIRRAAGSESSSGGILRQLENQGLKPNIVMRCDSPDAVKAAVRRKIGLGILYKDLVDLEVRRGDFKIIKLRGLKLERTSLIIYHREKPLSAAAQDFLTLLHQRRAKSE